MRAKQPKRAIVLTAVQTVTDDTMHVSSYEALMRYSSILSKQARWRSPDPTPTPTPNPSRRSPR